jgi:hypothetical protein
LCALQAREYLWLHEHLSLMSVLDFFGSERAMQDKQD